MQKKFDLIFSFIFDFFSDYIGQIIFLLAQQPMFLYNLNLLFIFSTFSFYLFKKKLVSHTVNHLFSEIRVLN